MLNRMLKGLRHDQRGITGLETAIILIAFVVVASVFAYTVLSAGIFSSEKGKEAVHAGLESARGSMELVGSVIATSTVATVLDGADTASNWTNLTNVSTPADDTADRKEGTGSVTFTVQDAFTTGLIAYNDLASTFDLTSPDIKYSLQFWIKSNTAVADTDLQILLDESTGCGSPEEALNAGALTANTWKHVQLKLTIPFGSTPADDNAVACVGLRAQSELTVATLNVDLIEAPAEVTQLHVVVANALDGEPIDLTTTTDGDSDSIISDESTKSHKVSIVYTDEDQRTLDMAWTKIELGKGDGDNLLEPGEKMRITVNTQAADPMPIADKRFSILMVRNTGNELVVERTLPRNLDTSMDLN